MMNPLLIKIIVGVILIGGVGAGGYIKGLKDQPEVKLTVPKCPDCNCPPALGNELQKVKGKYITLELKNTQYNTNTINGDSLAFVHLVQEIRQAIAEDCGKKRR